ncbi:uncharacterized protein LOC130808284 [Amaranthus tricolor]|uniref:uncharacterized protein LOC130808284 n=1 Tax=Amaranthus tricolor TaxID=29722 RepID=UPI0025846C3C|nr:uncharacterized protein LOC130808284 [Amaranthus tricolor]
MDCDFFEQSYYYSQPDPQGERASNDLSWLICLVVFISGYPAFRVPENLDTRLVGYLFNGLCPGPINKGTRISVQLSDKEEVRLTFGRTSKRNAHDFETSKVQCKASIYPPQGKSFSTTNSKIKIMKRKQENIASIFAKHLRKESGDKSNPTQQSQAQSNNPTPTLSSISSSQDEEKENPGKRRRMPQFHPSDRDIVRREYCSRDLCQPYKHEFKLTKFGIQKTDDNVGQDSFVMDGFHNWKRSESFDAHQDKDIIIELLKFHAKGRSDVEDVVLDNAPKNCQMIAPLILKDIIIACAKETTKAIIAEIGDECFAILADESTDISDKEELSVCLRYVSKSGGVVERFLGIQYVRLNWWPQNFNLDECSSAHYVHCFAHQLQLTLVATSKKSDECRWLFDEVLPHLLNFVGELESGSGLNKELGLIRLGDTRWSTYFKCIKNVLGLFRPILESFEAIADPHKADWTKAYSIISMLMSFDFIFIAHLMGSIFGLTNSLNMSLQKKYQDIDHAMSLTCNSSHIGGGRRMVLGKAPQVTNLHHYRVEIFLSVIDLQLQELDNRFSEKTKDMLICMACFSPSDGFSSFNTKQLLNLAKFCPNEFPNEDLIFFEASLKSFIGDVRNDE